MEATGIIFTALIMVVSFFVPANMPSILVPLVSVLAVREWYKQAEDALFAEHFAAGDQPASWGGTIGLSLLCVAAMLSIVMLLALVLPEAWLESPAPMG